MTGVTPDHLHRFVERAAARLRGDWVLLDGAVLPLLGLEIRVTLDIDVAGPDGATQADVVTLLEIAVECGLPPEAVNTAGAFFLRALRARRSSCARSWTGCPRRTSRTAWRSCGTRRGRALRPTAIACVRRSTRGSRSAPTRSAPGGSPRSAPRSAEGAAARSQRPSTAPIWNTASAAT